MRPSLTRLSLVLLAGVVALTPLTAPAAAADAEPGVAIDLSGGVDGRGLLLAECDKPVYRIRLTVRGDKDGPGAGTLVLDPTAPEVDEFGLPKAPAARPPVKLECVLKFVKKKTIQMRPAGAPAADVDWWLYEIKGPKITSNLTIATEGRDWSYARLLASDKDAKDGAGRIAVTLRAPEPLHFPPPCHPGCFPAGTPIQTPDGTRPVDAFRVGDVLATVNPAGVAGRGKVAAIFVTTNRLVDVRTEDGKSLRTTETQPLSLADADGKAGGLRPAGELKPGDRIQTWDGRERRAAVVRSVTPTGREARVYNLVLGEPVLFVAGGFLARSKPPAPPPGADDAVVP